MRSENSESDESTTCAASLSPVPPERMMSLCSFRSRLRSIFEPALRAEQRTCMLRPA